MNYNTRFYIEPYVHVNCQDKEVLLYNTYTNDVFVSNNKELIEKLLSFKNRKCTVIQPTKNIYNLVNDLRERFFGDFVDDLSDDTPLIIPGDLIRIVKNKDFILNKEQRSTGNTISDNLFCLDIYLDHFRDNKAEINNQCLLLKNRNESGLLIKSQIKDLIEKRLDSYKNLESINFFISDIEAYKFILSFITILKDKYILNLNVSIKDFLEIGVISDINLFSNVFVIIKDMEIEFLKSLQLIEDMDSIIFKFFIKGEQDVESLNKYNIDSDQVELIPYYNGNNISFFEEFVFMDKESLLEEKITMQTIHKNYILNDSDFGRLIIDSKGDVYTNLYCQSLGNLKSEDFNIILQKAYSSDRSSWFTTRKDVLECKECIYNALCPPIGNFERLFKGNALCHLSHNNSFSA